jgi:hypothetical protein
MASRMAFHNLRRRSRYVKLVDLSLTTDERRNSGTSQHNRIFRYRNIGSKVGDAHQILAGRSSPGIGTRLRPA